MKSRANLIEYGQSTRKRFERWWDKAGICTDFQQPGKVYYGEVNLHEVLERTCWHSGQHTRQIILLLREKLNLEPNGVLTDTDFSGLPMPKNVWDNERSFDEESYSDTAETWNNTKTH